MSKKPAKVQSKYKNADEKRKARNERVRLRRAKIRAAKRKQRRTGRAAVVTAVAVEARMPKFSLVVAKDSVAIYREAEYMVAVTEVANIRSVVDALHILASELGANITVHDLRA